MKVLVIGSGGREHALAWQLKKSPRVRQVFCAPGNPGTLADGCENWDLPVKAPFTELIERSKREGVHLVVVGPEQPLVDGAGDRFRAAGFLVFGPDAAGARLEGSKAWAKEVMNAAGVPTAKVSLYRDFEGARAHLDAHPGPWVLKADGLAAGKGVVVCFEKAHAIASLEEIFVAKRFGAAGELVLIEEFLKGYEVSVLALCDGKDVRLLPPSQDHKRVFDGDEGPNTGGMGVYSPVPPVTEAHLKIVRERVLLPTLAELRKRGIDYRGCLYAGLMIDGDEVNVVEFNARFGDPETECVLPLLESDLAEALHACAAGDLSRCEIVAGGRASCTVILASGGYPGDFTKGHEITGLENVRHGKVYHAGTRLENGKVVTAGGRVLAVTAVGDTLERAIASAYADVVRIHFDGMQHRSDIGRKGLSPR